MSAKWSEPQDDDELGAQRPNLFIALVLLALFLAVAALITAT